MIHRTGRMRLAVVALGLLIAVEILVVVSSTWVAVAARGRVIQAAGIPEESSRTMIVLGAKAVGGEPGVYLRARLQVALEAYRAGHVETIVVSGNDADRAGNEVRVMATYLTSNGVPDEQIIEDPQGLNTNATCRRAATDLAITDAMIVTQNFHIARAVTLCRAWGINIVGVTAPCDDCSVLSQVRNQLREALLSRPRAVLDSLRAGR